MRLVQEAAMHAVTERSHLAINRFSWGPALRISFMALKNVSLHFSQCFAKQSRHCLKYYLNFVCAQPVKKFSLLEKSASLYLSTLVILLQLSLHAHKAAEGFPHYCYLLSSLLILYSVWIYNHKHKCNVTWRNQPQQCCDHWQPGFDPPPWCVRTVQLACWAARYAHRFLAAWGVCTGTQETQLWSQRKNEEQRKVALYCTQTDVLR